jgi:uncharacterized protein YndB with AHSA1/START domain
MMTNTRTVRVEQSISVSPAAVYQAFTNSSALREWLADVATTAPQPGGRIYLAWNDGYYAAGSFTALEPAKAVAFNWQGRGEPGPSVVRVTLAPEEGSGTRVTVHHEGLGTGDEWQETIGAAEKRWRHGLENLAAVLTSGEDLRLTRRPMLGITVGDFDEAIAAELGVPVTEGIRLDGLVTGMGAAAAGLQAGDVVVGIGDDEVRDWPSLSRALAAHRAGDTVDVTFYRGSEKRTVPMTLSGRPVPEIPASLAELANAVRARYQELAAELDAFFAGVSDAAAMHKPAADAWSAAEALAHLIHGERYTHVWIAELAGGHEGWHDDWVGNEDAQVAATVIAYSSVQALLDELKRHYDETVAFIAHLPERFAERKGSFWRLAFNLLDEPYHHRAHLEQMREAIAQAPAAEPVV